MASFLALAGVFIAVLVGLVYIFGIPPALKSAMEEKALDTMGENKASYMMKDTISGLPGSDERNVKDLNKGLSNAAGGALQNPLGKEAGESGDKLTKPLTGR